MSGDPIELLRDADPVKDGGNAPAFEDVREWVQREQARVSPGRRIAPPRWLRALAPALGVAVTAAVVAVVVIAVGAHHSGPRVPRVPRKTAVRAPGADVPSPTSLLPSSGGMRGLLVTATVAGSGHTVRVSFVQCTNCGDSTPPDAREVNWSATSTDGGHEWRAGRARLSIVALSPSLPEGSDVWESGYAPHAGDPTFFVSHDGGRSYTPARSPADSTFNPVTLGDGEAWTLGVRCVRFRCESSVLHGPAGGSSLSRTTAQPPGMPSRRAPTSLLVAGYGSRAYVSEPGHRSLYVTENNGGAWSRASYPCSARAAIDDLTSIGNGAVWATCAPTLRNGREPANVSLTIRRSDDNGHSWQTPGPVLHGAAKLVAVSPQVLWAEESSGALQRSTDGGRSWQRVLSAVGTGPAVDIQSSSTATVVATATAGTPAAHNRRTDLVTYRTVDGGAHWTHTVIRLPAG